MGKEESQLHGILPCRYVWSADWVSLGMSPHLSVPQVSICKMG